MPAEPMFEEGAIADAKALEDAVAAYRRKRITRATMVTRVRAVVEQYDAITRGIEYDRIEEELGEPIEEFWAERDAEESLDDEEDGWGVDEDDADDEDNEW